MRPEQYGWCFADDISNATFCFCSHFIDVCFQQTISCCCFLHNDTVLLRRYLMLFYWDQHYSGVIMSTLASQIISLTIVYSIVYSGTDQRKHQSSTSLAFVRGINQWPVNSPIQRASNAEMFPFDDVIIKFDDALQRKHLAVPWLWHNIETLSVLLLATDGYPSQKASNADLRCILCF